MPVARDDQRAGRSSKPQADPTRQATTREEPRAHDSRTHRVTGSIEPPSLGEILRRLDSLQVSLVDLIAEMKADRAENARIYVRADVYNVAQTAQNAIVADLHRDVGKVDTELRAEINAVKTGANNKFAVMENERKADIAGRRQLALWVAGLAVTTALTIAGFVIQLTR